MRIICDDEREIVPPDNVGVVLIDMQRLFTESIEARKRELMISAQGQIVRSCATLDIPLVVLEYDGYGQTIRPLADEITKVPSTILLIKTFDDGFMGTRLHEVLQGLGVKSLVLMGINASYCVLSTASSAIGLGYKIFVPKSTIADIGMHSETARSIRWYQANGTLFHHGVLAI